MSKKSEGFNIGRKQISGFPSHWHFLMIRYLRSVRSKFLLVRLLEYGNVLIFGLFFSGASYSEWRPYWNYGMLKTNVYYIFNCNIISWWYLMINEHNFIILIDLLLHHLIYLTPPFHSFLQQVSFPFSKEMIIRHYLHFWNRLTMQQICLQLFLFPISFFHLFFFELQLNLLVLFSYLITVIFWGLISFSI